MIGPRQKQQSSDVRRLLTPLMWAVNRRVYKENYRKDQQLALRNPPKPKLYFGGNPDD